MEPGDLDALFEPLVIRGMRLRNRFVMPAMQRGFMEDGAPTPRMVEYLRRCAAGGTGLLISESTSIDHWSAYWQPLMGRLEPRTLPAWRRVVEAVHGEGAAYLAQLWHPGAIRRVTGGHPLAAYPALSPSGLVQAGRANGRAATREELEELEAAYVRAALDAVALGADGVEVHACHGYFLDQFLWAETNRREDEWGGATLAARARYPAAIVRAIRAAVPEGFVISFRISQFKEVDYGATIADSPEDLAGMLAVMREAGVDLFNVSSRKFRKPEWPDREQPGHGIAQWARSFTDAPVMTCGSVGLDLEMFANLFDDEEPAEMMVERDLALLAGRVRERTIDLVGIGRMHIANPDFVARVRAGRARELHLFNKKIHLASLAEAMAAEPGLVEESRKVADVD